MFLLFPQLLPDLPYLPTHQISCCFQLSIQKIKQNESQNKKKHENKNESKMKQFPHKNKQTKQKA